MSDVRVEFEKWAESNGLSIRRSQIDTGDYSNKTSNDLWHGWRESRRLMIVQLPACKHIQGEQVYAQQEVKQAIIDAGAAFKS